ncbi:hypothetical protein RB653_002158 [Dictyostelium firmibasis]|uniref:Periodic tryptophan protein 1 homolog n=1 Tax=Dictyostelium firmibasis TaxID=79012 RepID=A0AAN7U856_9MYCE
MISSIQWIPRGASNPFPKKFDPNGDDMGELDEEEIKAMQEEKNENQPLSNKKPMDDKEKDFNKRYNFDNYDSDDEVDEDEEGGDAQVSDKTEEVGLKFINRAMKGLMFYKDSESDPYLANQEEEDIEDIEDVIIRPSDSILVSAIVTGEDDYSHLDIMVYEDYCDNLYVHHDIILSSYPLALAWMDQDPMNAKEKGSFIAVGTFEPSIEIWDLDIVDNLIPTVILGGKEEDTASAMKKPSAKKRGGKQNRFKEGSHRDGVMSLSWNSQQRNVLASGSSDNTVKVWDITTQQCLNTFTHHKDKISSLQWNSQEKTALLIGSHDKHVSILDVRAPESAYKWSIKGEVESLSWNPHNAKEFIVGTDDGRLICYDATLGTTAAPVWSIQAHEEGSVSCFSYCSHQVGFFATGSSDNTIKLWHLPNSSNQPTLIESKNLGQEVFTLSFFEDSPFLLAIGSESQRPNIIDTKKFTSVQNSFGIAKPEGSKEPVLISNNKNKNKNVEVDDEETDSDHDDDIIEENDDDDDDEEEEEEEEITPQPKPTKKTNIKNNKKDTKNRRKVGDSDEE